MQDSAIMSLWNNRGFIKESTKREFLLKYRNSVLGSIWAVLNPLALIVVYTVIFSNVMHSKLPGVNNSFSYSIYLCSGVFAWTLFSETITRCQGMYIDNANLLKKIAFPKLSLPVIVFLSAMIGFFILFCLFLCFLAVADALPGWVVIYTLPLLLLQSILALSLGVTLGILNVYFRDVGHSFAIILQFWFWFTPIVYPDSILPAFVKDLMVFNPLYGIIQGYHSIFVTQSAPPLNALMSPLVASVVFLCLACYIYRKYADEMVDEL